MTASTRQQARTFEEICSLPVVVGRYGEGRVAGEMEQLHEENRIQVYTFIYIYMCVCVCHFCDFTAVII